MLKKVLIAGVAVVLALLVVSYVVPRRFADACLWLKERRDAAEESIPPEREIAILKAKIDALEKDDGYQFHNVAKLSAEVKEAERNTNQFRDRLVNSEKRIGAMHAALKAEGLQVNYESRRWAREELKTEFETSVDSYRLEEKRMRAMETELAAKRQTLDVAKKNLEETRLTRDQLKADLETLRAELALEHQAQQQERRVASDPKAAEAREKLDSIRRRISVMKEERDAFINQRWGGAVDATSAKR